jgi:hypothetical protein
MASPKTGLDKSRAQRSERALPQSLENLLSDYDAEKIRKLTRRFLEDRPKGKEHL